MHDQLIKKLIEEEAEKVFPTLPFSKVSFIRGANLLSPDLVTALTILEKIREDKPALKAETWVAIIDLLSKYKP